jgi:hypothetical protein
MHTHAGGTAEHARSELVQFEAVRAWQAAALAQWPQLPPVARADICRRALDHPLQAPALSGAVRNQVRPPLTMLTPVAAGFEPTRPKHTHT